MENALSILIVIFPLNSNKPKRQTESCLFSDLGSAWMDGEKVAVGNKGMTVEVAQKIWKSGEPWYISNWMSFTLPFLLGPLFFQTTLPCSGGYHLVRNGMPLHDAIEINCKKGATTEYQGAVVKYMG